MDNPAPLHWRHGAEDRRGFIALVTSHPDLSHLAFEDGDLDEAALDLLRRQVGLTQQVAIRQVMLGDAAGHVFQFADGQLLPDIRGYDLLHLIRGDDGVAAEREPGDEDFGTIALGGSGWRRLLDFSRGTRLHELFLLLPLLLESSLLLQEHVRPFLGWRDLRMHGRRAQNGRQEKNDTC